MGISPVPTTDDRPLLSVIADAIEYGMEGDDRDTQLYVDALAAVDTIAMALAAEAIEKVAMVDALRETIPYMNGVASDPANAPWRRETAEGVLLRVRQALGDATS